MRKIKRKISFLGVKEIKSFLNWRLYKDFFNHHKAQIRIILLASLIIFSFRGFGYLQSLEYDFYDSYINLRGSEEIDRRIVLLEIKEEDLSNFEQYPLNDFDLFNLLSKIQEQKPRIIGLDLYRDRPVNPEYKNGGEKLSNFFKDIIGENIIGIEKAVFNFNSPPIGPNPILSYYRQVGGDDAFADRDDILRRVPLFILRTTNEEGQQAKIINIPSFNYLIANLYLEGERVGRPSVHEKKKIQFGNQIASPLKSNSGGYVDIYTGGFQMLLNYRNSTFKSITASELLSNKIPPDLLEDKIVIVASNNPSFPDYIITPKGQMAGGEFQAHAISQLISAALDNRSFINTWPEAIEIIWIGFWISLPVFIIFQIGKEDIWNWDVGQKNRLKKQKKFFIIKVFATGLFLSLIAWIITLISFLWGAWWLPLVPTIFGIILATILATNSVYIAKLKEAHESKDAIILQKSKKIKLREKQLSAKSKLASIGLISSGIAHNIGNCLNNISCMISLSKIYTQTILEEQFDNLSIETREHLEEIIKSNLTAEEELSITVRLIEEVQSLSSEENRNQSKIILDRISIESKIESILNSIKYSLFDKEDGKKSIYKRLNDIISTSYDSQIEDCYLDKIAFHQVIQNLLINALDAIYFKYKANGETYSPQIKISAQNLNDFILIKVKDNGGGIKEEQKEDIFKPFISTKEGKRMGLGLTTVLFNLAKSGAKYSFTSDSNPGPNQGTEFSIYWPKIFSIEEVTERKIEEIMPEIRELKWDGAKPHERSNTNY